MSDCTSEQTCGPCGATKTGIVWTIRQGALFSHLLKIRRRSTGSSFNLAGYSVRAFLRRNLFDQSIPALAVFTCTVLDEAAGKVRVKLGATLTRGLYDRGVFDVEVYSDEDPDEVYRVYQGTFVVDLEATTT